MVSIILLQHPSTIHYCYELHLWLSSKQSNAVHCIPEMMASRRFVGVIIWNILSLPALGQQDKCCYNVEGVDHTHQAISRCVIYQLAEQARLILCWRGGEGLHHPFPLTGHCGGLITINKFYILYVLLGDYLSDLFDLLLKW